ncbi:hypothetical protein FJT64_007171 [Amphibalanus amphitrite]|uniref:O-acyltransferase WSD1 C-terminal domain-containing protein n=1 Tax=Amphibalanus amphitrite TaxID=1232801 RepID=A0A6A4VWV5_AMPAM|nr:hypothetical protein FJT64_007171 [Amphibalanus amphitrite]
MVATPVDLRHHEAAGGDARLANTFSLSHVPLPTRTEGAVPRLWAARRVMDDLKTSADTAVSRLLTRAFYTLLPASWAHRLAQRSLLLPSTVLLANLAGPEAPIQLGGCQVRAMFTLMPPPASAHASISVITYGDTVNVCVVSRAAGGGRPARRLLTELRRQLQERLSGVQSQLQALRATSTADDSEQELCEDRQHAARLQREFAELLTELQRRRSPLGGGAVVTCEAEAAEVELRRPKKLTVVSRQSSTSSASSQSRPLPFGDAEDLR